MTSPSPLPPDGKPGTSEGMGGPAPGGTGGSGTGEGVRSLLIAIVIEQIFRWFSEDFGSFITSIPGGRITAVLVLALPVSLFLYHRRLAGIRARSARLLAPVTSLLRNAFGRFSRRSRRARQAARGLRSARPWVATAYIFTGLGMAAGLVLWGGQQGVSWLAAK
ncbi:hypothetical protein [Planomonospora parontospora]|uniref:hypothetical protein n=1 Tax=Planomonospora parontospora TaxID=58119 RepID=UPI001670793B|nr:hypothetical protein [Planomonospora parontospora]GGL02806.1 hypothetical protein GCM10014719_01220 [Planomonospora parontospora subsp. antibiotica]GII13282.1 hypothetical protein Ppa05_00080 [Planomonospora parontospora subsp. antibiotica]